MTAITVIHTLLSVWPVGFGLAAFVRHGGIAPKTRLGKWYLGTMLVATVGSFAFLPIIGFTPGQVLTLITLGLLVAGVLTRHGQWRGPGYMQTITLSATYLMLMVFFTTETLKRVPVGHPFASSPTDPALIPVRLALLVMFAIGVAHQVLKIHAANSPAARLERLMASYRNAV